MTRQRILVTGGAGFIGSHTVDLLLQQDKQVLVLDNLTSGKLTNLTMQHPNLEFIEGDVLEYPLLVDLLKSCDAVLHLATIPSVQQSIEDPVYTFQVNVQGFLHVLQAVHESHRPIRVVYASSASVYGDAKDLPCRDDVPLTSAPISPYALHKINNEQYAAMYERLHGIKSLGLRYFNVYGTRQDPNSPYSGVISRFIEAYKQVQPLTIIGDGKQTRDFIHISDIARANSLALEKDYAGVLNIATGYEETLLELVDYIEKTGTNPAEKFFLPARPGDIRHSYALTTLAEQHLGFRYQMKLEEGLRQMMTEGI